MDALLLTTIVDRPVRFIIAAKSHKKPVTGFFSR